MKKNIKRPLIIKGDFESIIKAAVNGNPVSKKAKSPQKKQQDK